MFYRNADCVRAPGSAPPFCLRQPLFKSSPVDETYISPGTGQFYALPKGYVSLTIERKLDANKTPALTVTMNEPESVPDTDHIYVLKYDHSEFSADKVKIETSERGLVTGVTTTTKDPLPGAIREFANFVVGVATSGISPTTAAAAAVPSDEAFKVEARFDPAEAESWANLRDHLREQYGVTIEIERPPLLGAATDEAIAAGCEEMVCYRFVLPYRITVEDPVSNARAEAIVVLPNEGPIAGIWVVRRSFAENKFTLTFTNGVLTTAEYDDPSALVGALMIPIDIAKAIVSIPSALFRFTIAHEATGITAQKNLLDAQKQLAQAHLDLRELRSG